MIAATTPIPQAVDATIVHRLVRWRRERPDQIAFIFVDAALEKISELTFAELWDQAAAFAIGLQQRSPTGPDARIGLLLPAGKDFVVAFFGVLISGSVAVPLALPVRSTPASVAVTEAILDDCSACYVVAEPSSSFGARPMADVATLVAEGESRSLTDAIVAAEDLAFLQYTSGSTGQPKGVMVSHENLMANSHAIYARFEHNDDTRVFSWLPHYHDMGLVGGIVQPVFGGFPVVTTSPLTFARRPLRWIEGISRYRCTVSGAPNFAYASVIKRLEQAAAIQLDLSCWKLAFVGAEPISLATLNGFASALSPFGFERSSLFPCYGMAENTLIATGDFLNGEGASLPLAGSELVNQRKAVGCGRPVDGNELVVVSPATGTACADGKIGEAWIRSASVARGYWNRPELNALTFDQHFGGQRGFYRTGDLGFTHLGCWHPVARLKEVLIIRGRNFAAEDFEITAAAAHPGVEPGGVMAFSAPSPDGERFILLAEAQRGAARLHGAHQIGLRIQEALLASFGVKPDEVLIVSQRALPRTTSGKVARRTTRQRWEEGLLNQSSGVLADESAG